MPGDAAELDSAPTPPYATSIYVWGNEREEVSRITHRVAARLTPNYVWLQADGSETASGPDLVRGPGMKIVPGKDLLPKRVVSEERLWSYLRPRGHRNLGRDLLEFLGMSDALQEAVASVLRHDVPRVLVLGNVDQMPPLPSDDRQACARLIEFLNSREATLIVSQVGHPRPERIDFEYSIATPSVLPAGVRQLAAVCQWGDCADCIVNRIFPPDELVCIGRLPTSRRSERGDSLGPSGFASH